MAGSGSRALALALLGAGAVVAVAYPYGLFYLPENGQWLLVRATLALLALLVGSFISATGLAILALGRSRRSEAEDTSEG